MAAVPLPDGSSKKKTVIKRQWPGLRGLWENRHYRKWAIIWFLSVLVCAVIVFGEPLRQPEQIVDQTIHLKLEGGN